jgi:16S rRNA (guanine966-N2)-methyltransferase
VYSRLAIRVRYHVTDVAIRMESGGSILTHAAVPLEKHPPMPRKSPRQQRRSAPFGKAVSAEGGPQPLGDEATSPPRLIGGELKGRRLAFRPGGPTRPMKDRVRETLFDLLGTSIRGAIAIDLFAGTGALGFEAISRGAIRAIFAERHFPTADCLRRSGRDLEVDDRIEVIAGDVLLWPRRLPPLPQDAPWMIFVSPPWSFFQTRMAELTALMRALAAEAPPESRLLAESDDAISASDLPDRLSERESEQPWDSRRLVPAILHQKRL